MPPRSEPVPRARAALHWLSGFLLLGVMAGGIVAAAVALWQNVDVESLARSAAAVDEPPPSPAEALGPVAAAAGGAVAAIFVSSASKGYFPDSAFYRSTVRRWSSLLGEAGMGHREIATASDVESLDPNTLLVLPQAACLSKDEVEALHAHVAAGGGLVLTWATGARDEQCEWRGWDPLLSLTGAPNLGELDMGGPVFLTLPAGFPLSAGLAPGSRMELHIGPRVAVDVAGPRAYWSDWALNRVPAPVGAWSEGGGPGTSAPDAAAVLHTTAGGGRVAWFGFDIDEGVSASDDWRIRRTLLNGVIWASGGLIAEVSAWPQGHRAAAFIGEDVESGFSNSAELARLLKAKGAAATFFVVSGLAAEHPDLADSLAIVGEIGSQTSDHNPTAGLSLSEQAFRLERSWNELRDWAGIAPRGLRPPEERFDERTLRAWRDVGGTYVAAVNGARSASPEVFETVSGPIVLLPRLVNDDYNVFVQSGARRPVELRDAWLAGARKLAPLGGLAYLALRTQVAGTPERVWVVGEVIDSLRTAGGPWWLATGGEIADWWLSRAAVEVAIQTAPPAVTVDLSPGRPTYGAWMEVYGPEPARDLAPFVGDRALPYSRTAWGIRFPLPGLAADEDLRIQLVPAVNE